MGSRAQRSALYATAKIALGSLAVVSCAGRSTASNDSSAAAGGAGMKPNGDAGQGSDHGWGQSGSSGTGAASAGSTVEGSGGAGRGGNAQRGGSSMALGGGGAARPETSGGIAGTTAGAGGADHDENGASSAGQAPGIAGNGSQLTCVGPTLLSRPPVEPVPTQAEFECCLSLVHDGASTNWGSPEGVTLLPSAPYANCCRAIIQAVEVDRARYSTASSVDEPCCKLAPKQELWQYLLCTPWGPPVPPSIGWSAA